MREIHLKEDDESSDEEIDPKLEEAILGIKAIVRSMVRKKQFGGKHTEETTLTRRIRRSSKGAQGIVLDFLKKSNWFNRAKKTQEWHYSLNVKKNTEIFAFLNSDLHEAIKIITD